MADNAADPILRVSALHKHFEIGSRPLRRGASGGVVRAVDGVDLEVRRGETFGIVGETGCGKSTLARLIVRLQTPTSGDVAFQGEPVTSASKAQLRAFRQDVQMVFQDPYGSLNPRMTVGDSISAPLTVLNMLTREGRQARARDLMREVGLDPAHATRYPHEFSGGQRQRIAIARALAPSPKLIVADEPISALDVSMQAQILNLLMDLQRQHGLTFVLIAHDLNVVKHVSDHIAVMYLGRIVEVGRASEIYARPLHPYTRALISSMPTPGNRAPTRRRIVLRGSPPAAINLPQGCRFRSRCPIAADICAEEDPTLADHSSEHAVACFFPGTEQVAR